MRKPKPRPCVHCETLCVTKDGTIPCCGVCFAMMDDWPKDEAQRFAGVRNAGEYLKRKQGTSVSRPEDLPAPVKAIAASGTRDSGIAYSVMTMF